MTFFFRKIEPNLNNVKCEIHLIFILDLLLDITKYVLLLAMIEPFCLFLFPLLCNLTILQTFGRI